MYAVATLKLHLSACYHGAAAAGSLPHLFHVLGPVGFLSNEAGRNYPKKDCGVDFTEMISHSENCRVSPLLTAYLSDIV